MIKDNRAITRKEEIMRIGLIDVDGHNFPNLPLMKLSAWHKQKGDSIEWYNPLIHSFGEPFDKVYMSKIFSDEYTKEYTYTVNAKEVVKGGTGYCISVVDGKEVFDESKNFNLPDEIEHIYPDYSLYPDYTNDMAYGFLTRGCCNNCSFCVVSKKEGRCSEKVADLSEFWNGQKKIKLLDPNILACKDHLELLQQLIDSGAKVDFTQGLDARFINKENIELLKQIKMDMIHFAFDFMKFEKKIIQGLTLVRENIKITQRNSIVYMLTNYDTTIEQDLYRVNKIKELGFTPDVRIYRKESLPRPHVLRDLQRWCNNRFLYHSCDFMDFAPRKDGKTMRELYFND
jgi:hypothetical protein